MAALQQKAAQQQPRQTATQAPPAPKPGQPMPPARALQQTLGNRAVGAWAFRLTLAGQPLIQRQALGGAQAQTVCNVDQTGYIDTAMDDARAWRRSVLAWFEAYRNGLRQRAPIAGQYAPVGMQVLRKLQLLDRHFRISTAIQDRGSVFPRSAGERATARDLENFGNAAYGIRRRFNDVNLGGLTYRCQAAPDPSVRGRNAWGSSVPGSGELTIYTDALDPQPPEVKAAVAMHEAFHASFRDFSGDSYSHREGYPGGSPLTNADSYATFASIVATGRSYRSFGIRLPDVHITVPVPGRARNPAAGAALPDRMAFAQAKPLVSQPGDKFEREAEQVAGQIMRMDGGAGTGRLLPQARLMRCAASEASAQAIRGGLIPPGGGMPLDSATRTFFEPRFGLDLGRVRVHTGQQAAETAKNLNALAYTVGNHIVFGAGAYAPRFQDGKRLLAHELAHTFQASRAQMPGQRPGHRFASHRLALRSTRLTPEENAESRLFSAQELKAIEKLNPGQIADFLKKTVSTILGITDTSKFKRVPGTQTKREFYANETGQLIGFHTNGLVYYRTVSYNPETKKRTQTISYFDKTGNIIKSDLATGSRALIAGTFVQEEISLSTEPVIGGQTISDIWKLTDPKQFAQTLNLDSGVGNELIPSLKNILDKLDELEFDKGLSEELKNLKIVANQKELELKKTRSKIDRTRLASELKLIKNRIAKISGFENNFKQAIIWFKAMVEATNAEKKVYAQAKAKGIDMGETLEAEERIAVGSLKQLCNIIAYYLYGHLAGKLPEKLQFADYFIDQIQKGHIGMTKEKTTKGGKRKGIEGFSTGSGTLELQKQWGLYAMLGKKRTPISEYDWKVFDNSGVNLAISWQATSGHQQPNHFFLIVKDKQGVWRNMDHTSTSPEQRGGKTDPKKVFGLYFDENALREARKLLDEYIRAKYPGAELA